MNDLSFNELQMHDKKVLVDDFSEELCSIEFYDHRIYLYSLNALLIEAWHNIETREIEQIRTIEYGDLDKYLSRITMASLLAKMHA
jgi:hypothetical protein